MNARSSCIPRALLAAALCSGCGGDTRQLPPAGQLLLFIDTDAPLPPEPGSTEGSAELPALFDHLRVDVLKGSDAAPLTQRDFTLNCGMFGHGPISLGIATPVGEAGYNARVRLYRAADASSDEPSPSSTIEQILELPAVAENGVVERVVTLRVDDTGVPRRMSDDASTQITAAGVSALGTWVPATPTPCDGVAREGEVCVPGGAFWMGDPQLRNDSEVQDAEREHLVVVSPFFIDAHEVTVAELRAVQAELTQAGVPLPPEWTGNTEGLDEDDYSTFTLGPSELDPGDAQANMPVNAVEWETARTYCQLRGKDLPSEAMYEFLASGRGLEQKYVWGDDPPRCDDVVAGRAGFGVYATFDGACRPYDSPGGVLPAGSGRRDRIQLGTAKAPALVLDLAGSLSEWMLDWFNAEDEGAWATNGVLIDPVAEEPGRSGARRTVRGGSWRGRYVELRAAARVDRDPTVPNRSLGFRCAWRP